ncbi:hypothetical protein M9194_20240 [Vibrio sp. S4M6]|uniref:cupredoxin domain-containing protein n=1 Tax=Vibrio sinus TaxID=2946865 RepID=UPI00202AAEAD|nr:plastocyanin/azurin family copper-binding protein [Vibrio sinus]MCL9783759.1 hypothetical protein [Vibrio sinus]
MRTLLALLFASVATTSFAATDVVEGEAAKSAYEASKDASTSLLQKRKTFYFKEFGMDKPKRKPKEIRVKAGEVIYILNNEKKITHNIFDESDNSWVLAAQEPGDVAAVTFNDKGEHKLKCAIHPKMKLTLIVE